MLRLNIACGANVFPDWVNLDREDMEEKYLKHIRGLTAEQVATWPEHQRVHVAALEAGRMKFEKHDLRRGFRQYANGSVDAIYLGQMIEHLNRRTEVEPFLRECHRLLKKGGLLRITTPSLSLLLLELESGNMGAFDDEQPEFYRDASQADKFCYLLFGASGPDCTRENYEGHFHCYTRLGLTDILSGLGFECREHDDQDPRWEGIVDCGMSHSLGIDAERL